MRLTCPNCRAQYEVPESVIPQDGRDVQCSNCGDTWFQARDLPEETATPPEEDFSVATQEPAADAGSNDDADTPEPRGQRGLDPELAEILRAEAEREASLRAQARANLETQPDLGLESAPRPEPQTDSSLSAPTEPSRVDATQVSAAMEQESRRGLLPDIEEINSTLRAADHNDAAQVAAAALTPRSNGSAGFQRGFFLAVLAAIALVLIYSNAPQIAAKLPQTDPWMSKYVASVDGARLWLDSKVATYVPTPDIDE